MNYKFEQAEVVKLFSNFLKKHRAYKRYNVALRKRAKYIPPGPTRRNNITEMVAYIYSFNEPLDVLVDRAFTWSGTPNGHNYWSTLDASWRKYIRDAESALSQYNSVW